MHYLRYSVKSEGLIHNAFFITKQDIVNIKGDNLRSGDNVLPDHGYFSQILVIDTFVPVCQIGPGNITLFLPKNIPALVLRNYYQG